MLHASRDRIMSTLADDAVVVDIGGWGQPFQRADWVVDLMPYETRGLYGYARDHAVERFSAHTWVQRDICDCEPLPFADDEFDFAICSHTLEDVRDPIQVCREISRIAKAGYVEVPSRLVEQAWGVEGPWVGWGHHRWLIDVVEDGLRFVAKHQIVHHGRRYRFPPGYAGQLSDEQRVTSLWWEGSFAAYEEIHHTDAETDAHLAGFVSANSDLASPGARARFLGSQSWLARRVVARLRNR